MIDLTEDQRRELTEPEPHNGSIAVPGRVLFDPEGSVSSQLNKGLLSDDRFLATAEMWMLSCRRYANDLTCRINQKQYGAKP